MYPGYERGNNLKNIEVEMEREAYTQTHRQRQIRTHNKITETTTIASTDHETMNKQEKHKSIWAN